jgi:hypothetical protein
MTNCYRSCRIHRLWNVYARFSFFFFFETKNSFLMSCTSWRKAIEIRRVRARSRAHGFAVFASLLNRLGLESAKASVAAQLQICLRGPSFLDNLRDHHFLDMLEAPSSPPTCFPVVKLIESREAGCVHASKFVMRLRSFSRPLFS